MGSDTIDSVGVGVRVVGGRAAGAAISRGLQNTVGRGAGRVLSCLLIGYCSDPPDEDDECEEEWEAAYAFCDNIAARNSYGGGWSISGSNHQQCIMGQVSERCGGNKVDHGY